MTSKATPHFNLPAFTPGPAPAAGTGDSNLFLEETEVTLDRLHRHVRQTLGELPSPTSDLPEGVSEGQSEPNNLFYFITLLAIVAGAILVVFTGF